MSSVTLRTLLWKGLISAPPEFQGLTLHVLHHQEVGPVLVTNVVERANVRMRQLGNALWKLPTMSPAR